MPENFTIQVEGLKELEAGLKELQKNTAKNCIRRSLVPATQPIADTAAQLIKVKRIPNPIAVSKIKFSSGDAGRRAFSEAMARGATREEAGRSAHAANAESDNDEKITSGVITIGPTKRAFYGFEFGTKFVAPVPFMRPAWDQHKMEALDIIKSELKAQIEKARIRIVTKQLRLLAKMNK